MHTWTVTWTGADGETLAFSGQRPTREAALRARLDKIRDLAERYPKRRTVQVAPDQP